MKTIYIPRGETVQYERLAADRLVVRGCLRVADSLRAKTICGDGVIHAGSVQADVIRADEVESAEVVCKRLIAKRVQTPTLVASISAVVSCFLSAAHVKAGKLTVAASEIDQLELTRARQKGRMTITYDGYEIRQHDLNEMFGERDVFLSIFNPLYFIEELGDDGKKLLERYMPAISHEQVLAALSESVRASLENESILSPEAYLKRRREEIRDLEQNVIYLGLV